MPDEQTTICVDCKHWMGDCTLGAPNPRPVKPVPMPRVLWCGGKEKRDG